MKQPETLIQTAIQKRIRALKGDSWKVHGGGTQRAGEPDLDAYIPYDYGHIHLKIEVKTKEGKPSKIQIVRLRKYWEAGYLACILTSPKDLDSIVRAYTDYIKYGLMKYDKPFINYLQEQGLTDEYNIYSRR